MKLKVFVGNFKSCYYHKCSYSNFIDSLDDKLFEATYDLKEADFILFMSCTIVGRIVNEAQKALNQINLNKKPGAILAVAACISKVHAIDLTGVNYILGDDWVQDALKILNNKVQEISTHIWYEKNQALSAGYCICEGCNSKCSFCKVHYTNNPLTSTPIEFVLDNIKKIADNKIAKLSLHGLSLGQYGTDLYGFPRLHEVLEYVESLNEIKIVELIDTAPQNMYPELIQQIAKSKKIKKMDLPFQTASNRLLKLMNRGYKIEDVTNIINQIRAGNPDILFNTTIMVSFPTETFEDIQMTLDYMVENSLGKCTQICTYEDYELIPSSKLKQLSSEDSITHSNTMLINMAKINKMYCESLVGTECNTYVFSNENGIFIGDHVDPIIIQRAPKDILGKVVRCKILHYRHYAFKNLPYGEFFADYIETVQ